MKSGFVTIIGRPNVGKSTLTNCMLGEKIAIVTNKPQTTRNKITCVLTGDDYQVVFIDTPGLHTPKSKLGEYMVNSVKTAIADADIVIYLIEPFDRINSEDRGIIEKIKNVNSKVFLAINKIDTVEKGQILKVMEAYTNEFKFDEIIPIAAQRGENVDVLVENIVKYLPEGPKYFPDDFITDQPERQIAAEIIREKILYLLQEEIPHGTFVEILSVKKRENKDLIDVDATIYCEKDSHKGMIIGKGGKMLKEIGVRARRDISRFMGSPINLQIWVKVKKDWRDNDFLLKSFGYEK